MSEDWRTSPCSMGCTHPYASCPQCGAAGPRTKGRWDGTPPDAVMAWRNEINRLISETFGIGRKEWRATTMTPICYESLWFESEAAAVERFRLHLGDRPFSIETRLVPLDFCTSLDAVRRVESTLSQQDRYRYVEHLVPARRDFADVAVALAFVGAEERCVALLRWRGVDVPPRPEEKEQVIG